jgi:hypothetical protein
MGSPTLSMTVLIAGELLQVDLRHVQMSMDQERMSLTYISAGLPEELGTEMAE